MKLSIRNYRKIHEADITLSPIALVAGLNGAGKTSCAQALSSALLGTTDILDGLKASESGSLIRSGADRAAIVVEGDKGRAEIKIPHGKLETKGERPPRASRYALGLQSIVTDSPAERSKILVEYLKAIPLKTDLAAALPTLDSKYVDLLWSNVGTYGWDGQLARSKETGAKLKGQWETLSGENWGSQKAQSWTPAEWSGELASRSVESLQLEVADTRQFLETAIAAGAVSDDERTRLETLAANVEDDNQQVVTQKRQIEDADGAIAHLNRRIADLRTAINSNAERAQAKALAKLVPDLEKAVENQSKVVTTAAAAIAEAEKKRDALPKPEASQTEIPGTHSVICPCPHCKKDVCLTGTTLSIPVGQEAKTSLADAARTRLARTQAIRTAEMIVSSKRDAANTANQELGRIQADLARSRAAAMTTGPTSGTASVSPEQVEKLEAERTETQKTRNEMAVNLGSLTKSLKDAQSAAAKLAELPATTVTEAEVNQHRENVRLAEQRLDTFKRKTEADRLAEKIALNTEIVAALDPAKGVRASKLADSLGSFNTALKAICTAATWPIVEVDSDLRTSIGGWRWSLASTSMQWRVRAALQLAMGTIDGSDVFIFDGADLLDVPGRNGLLRALISLKKVALVTMTESRPEKVPDLATKDVGSSYWVEDGAVRPIGEAVEARAA